MEIPNSPKFYKPMSDTAMQTPFTIYYTVECSSVPIPLYSTQLSKYVSLFSVMQPDRDLLREELVHRLQERSGLEVDTQANRLPCKLLHGFLHLHLEY